MNKKAIIISILSILFISCMVFKVYKNSDKKVENKESISEKENFFKDIILEKNIQEEKIDNHLTLNFIKVDKDYSLTILLDDKELDSTVFNNNKSLSEKDFLDVIKIRDQYILFCRSDNAFKPYHVLIINDKGEILLKKEYVDVQYDKEGTFVRVGECREEDFESCKSFYEVRVKELDKDLSLELMKDDVCNIEPSFYTKEGTRNIYTYCLKEINVVKNGEKVSLKEYLKDHSIEEIKAYFNVVGGLFDGGTLIYSDTGIDPITSDGISYMECFNQDIYIGPRGMDKDHYFCKS